MYNMFMILLQYITPICIWCNIKRTYFIIVLYFFFFTVLISVHYNLPINIINLYVTYILEHIKVVKTVFIQRSLKSVTLQNKIE